MTEKKTAPKKTPLDWANALGMRKSHGHGSQARSLLSPEYLVANTIYGWSAQAYHYQGKPFLITQECFEAAMSAAAKYPTVAPHKAAIPQVAENKFVNFKPLKASKGN